ncbi:MAG: MFS transporter [Elusimicrobia bacterium]|nr:MFS transporter [Elusimicrobiota bacterium]
MQALITAAKGHPLALFPDFRRLFAGRVISAVGDKFFSIAIAWWVLSSAGEASKLHLGLVMAVNVLPVVIFGPLLGTLSDRSNKRSVMLAADAARAGLVLLLSGLLWSGRLNLYWLYSVCFLISGFGPLFESAVAASIARLTSPEKMPQAVAVDASVLQVSNVVGSALGSVLMAAAGVAGAFLFNAGGYAASFAAVRGIRTRLDPEARTDSSFMAEFREGLAYTFGNKPLLYLILTFAAFNFFVSPILILIPMIVKFSLKESVTWLAVFETFFALGSALLALMLSFRELKGGIYRWLFVSLLVMGGCFAGLYFSGNKYADCLLLLAGGAALGGGNTLAITLFQSVVPDEMKGRFFSVLTTLAYAVMPLAFMTNGLLADKFSVGFCLGVNAAAILALSFVILLIPRVERGS